MDCKEIDAILDGHEIRSLTAAKRAAVDLHLSRCERCSDAWLVQETLVNESAAAPPPGLLAATAARAAAGSRACGDSVLRRRVTRRLGAGLGLAAAAAVAAVTIALVSLRGPGPNVSPVDAPTRADAPPNRTLTAQQQADGAGRSEPRGGGSGLAAAAPDVDDVLDLEPVLPDSRFLAGRDYERLPAHVPTGAAPGRIEVCEFFMFGCVHCYALEPELERWARTKPEHVDLVRVPALFNATARLHARAFYAAEALGVADDLRGPFYEEIHVRGNGLGTAAALEAFFARHGIDAAAFRDAFDSPAVRTKMERAEELNRRYRVSATPSLAVNGKYLTNAAMAGSAEALFEVVDSLVAAETAATCRERGSTSCPVY